MENGELNERKKKKKTKINQENKITKSEKENRSVRSEKHALVGYLFLSLSIAHSLAS